jgi:hypothetical protein
MKNLILIILAVLNITFLNAQKRVLIDRNLINYPVKTSFINPEVSQNQKVPGEIRSRSEVTKPGYYAVFETEVGNTYYDLQSNGVMHQRIHKFNDGTISTVWTMGFDELYFPDRGTGYNYFNGDTWGEMPEERIESLRTGWPSIAPWGENGEIICAHISNDIETGLLINRRPIKGAGLWTEYLLHGPVNPEYPSETMEIFWPTMVSSGLDNQTMHLLYITSRIVNGGSLYYGQDGALLYSRSTDGGVTWDILHHKFEELDSTYYNFIWPDSYIWAESKGETLSFVLTNSWMDFVLMKSTDKGNSWEKTVIWEHPYPKFDWQTTVTDTFYCPDNSGCVILDENDIAHVAFGITRLLHDEPGTYYTIFPFTDGIVYWNETMPVFTVSDNTLNPYGHPQSELIEDYNLVGWTQDVDNNGQIDLLDDIYSYSQRGVSTMPKLALTEYGTLYLIYASCTEGYDDGWYNYKHIWERHAFENGQYWDYYFEDMNEAVLHEYDECIFPSIAGKADDGGVFFTFQYMFDGQIGLATTDDHAYHTNSIMVADVTFQPGIDTFENADFFVSEPMPNPAKKRTSFFIESKKSLEINYKVSGIKGDVITESTVQTNGIQKRIVDLDLGKFNPGVYLLRVEIANKIISRKLVVY